MNVNLITLKQRNYTMNKLALISLLGLASSVAQISAAPSSGDLDKEEIFLRNNTGEEYLGPSVSGSIPVLQILRAPAEMEIIPFNPQPDFKLKLQ
jgi:hypothetical protein